MKLRTGIWLLHGARKRGGVQVVFPGSSRRFIPVFAFTLLAGGIGSAAAGNVDRHYTLLYAFQGGQDGAVPWGGLYAFGKTLYGTTPTGGAASHGTLYSVNAATGAETVLYSFQGGADGAYPQNPPVRVYGTLYGTTNGGGSYGWGTIFSFKITTQAEQPLYSFSAGADGASPAGALLNVGGTLYGADINPYNPGSGGAVFSFDTKTKSLNVLYDFQTSAGNQDAAYAQGALIDVNGMLYGTSAAGGAYGNGTVYSVDPTSGAETIVYSFSGNGDGGTPFGALRSVGGLLYGTTASGGANYQGAIYSLDPATGVETAIYSFQSGTDGNAPQAGVIANGSTLYGTTYRGGAFGGGTLFSLDLTTGVEKVLHSFGGSGDGIYPIGELILVGKKLYGTTQYGGGGGDCPLGGCGTVFSYTTP